MKKYVFLSDYFYIAAGSFILAIAINCFLLPCKLSTGGVSGIATVFFYVFKIPVSLTTLVANLVLFIIGFKKLLKVQLVKTVAGVLFLSFFLEMSSDFKFRIEDVFVSSVFGGVLIGVGVALTILKGASTGGTDFAAIMLRKNFRHISVTALMLVIDIAIIIISGLVFADYVITLYGIISLYIAFRVSDFMLVRGDFAKCVFVVSQKHCLVSHFIQSKMRRGVTGIYVKGLYRDSDGMMLMCVLKSKEVPVLMDGIKEIDADSFTIISDVRSVHGNGFGDYKQK